MESLCVFIHYSRLPYLPVYVQAYANELALYFDKVVIVHNRRPIATNLKQLNENISFASFENRGYDFGLFYNYFKTIDPEKYSRIACVNDSNILINSLADVMEWGKNNKYDFWGLVDSNESPWFSSHANNYHIQSHFLVFNPSAIQVLSEFVSAFDVKHIFEEEDSQKLRRMVIDKWEIGLSQYLLKADLSGGTYIDSADYIEKYNRGKTTNVCHKLYAELIKGGYPVLKKKIITHPSWRNRIKISNHWKKLINEYSKIEEKDQIIKELSEI